MNSLLSGHDELLQRKADLIKYGDPLLDATVIFAKRDDTLYVDYCCHFNQKGNQILSAEVLRFLKQTRVLSEFK